MCLGFDLQRMGKLAQEVMQRDCPRGGQVRGSQHGRRQSRAASAKTARISSGTTMLLLLSEAFSAELGTRLAQEGHADLTPGVEGRQEGRAYQKR